MNEASLVNNLPLNGDLRPLRIGDEVAPIELSKSQVRIQNLDVTGSFNIAGQDDNLLDRDGTNTYLKNIGDNFGMGTTTPTSSAGLSQFLEISGEGASGLILTDTTSSTPASYEIWTDANRLRFWDDTYGDVLTLNAGKVGIGTTSPAHELHIHEDDTPSLFMTNSGSGSDTAELLFGYDTTVLTKIKQYYPAGGDANLGFFTTTDTGSNVLERMTINHDGNVGI